MYTKQLTRSGILLALAIVFQNLRYLPMFSPSLPHSQFVIGTLVNLTLIIACERAGIWTALVISIATPVMARLQGQLAFDVLLPVVALGNVLYAAPYFFLSKIKRSNLMPLIFSSCLKYGFFVLSMPYILNIFVRDNMNAAEFAKKSSLVLYSFGLPQLITALAGGFLAFAILPILRRAERNAKF